MTVRYLIWDAGGTLFDTYPAVVSALRQALGELGYEAEPAWVMTLARQRTAHALNTLAKVYGVPVESLTERFRALYEAMDPQAQPPFPGVLGILRYARDIGGDNFIVTHRARASLLRLLDAHAMAALFRTWITADDGYPRKPDPASILALLARYALDPAQCLLVGDRDLDISAGQRAGIWTCFFGDEPHATQADLEIATFGALYEWLVEMNADT